MPPDEFVVPVAGDDERRDCCEPPREERECVERRLVRPVQVLQDEDSRPAPPELADQRDHDIMRPRACRDYVGKLAARDLGHIEQWAEGASGKERLACAPNGRRLLAEPPE